MLQYLYQLDYQFDGEHGTAPDVSTHTELWCLGKYLGIKGLTGLAADRFKMAFSQFDVFGSEVSFKLTYFEHLVTAINTVWEMTFGKTDYSDLLRNQVSIHVQQNIKGCAKKGGARSRFLESTYGLIFRETELKEPDFTAFDGYHRSRISGRT